MLRLPGIPLGPFSLHQTVSLAGSQSLAIRHDVHLEHGFFREHAIWAIVTGGTDIISSIVQYLSNHAREKRDRLFRRTMSPRESDRILDLGGFDGSHIAHILPYRSNITVADIDAKALEIARNEFGFNTLLLKEDETIPVEDGYYDIVYCSSVIEHTTGPKTSIYEYRSNRLFNDAAFSHQMKFASEIKRVGKKYFVQTPYRYFPIESHTWLPNFFVFCPRTIQIAAIRFLNAWWPKEARPDWHLLTVGDMRTLFPEADIIRERWMGMTKSIMAVNNK
ncbi:MAG: methyltransferase [Bacteroidota bacterium]